MATRGGAQVALQQSLILRPGNNQCIKNLNREGGHFWIVARGHFSVGITNRVVRFWNNQVLQETEAVLQVILDEVSEEAPSHPDPLPQGEEGIKSKKTMR